MVNQLKRVFVILLISGAIFSGSWLQAQNFDIYGLPTGGRNQLGIYSPLATAAGETILSQLGPQAAFLNPAVLGLTENRQLSVSGRLMVAFSENKYNYDNEFRTYSRKTLNPDFAGLTLKIGSWKIALGYSLIEEYNRPKIFNYNDFGTQDGRLHAFQFGLSRRLNDRLSLGVSANYRTGSLHHLNYIFQYEENEYQVDLRGINFQFGLAWKVNNTFTLAMLIRPAYRMKVDEKMEERDIESGTVVYSSQVTTYFRFPAVFCLSSSIKVSDSLYLYSDLSYWNWKQFSGGSEFSYDLLHIYEWPLENDALKFSSGLDYVWKLNGDSNKNLHLLAGYIHDPYGLYIYQTGIDDYLTCGLALSIQKFALEASAKLPLARVRKIYTIDSSAFQLGLNYKF